MHVNASSESGRRIGGRYRLLHVIGTGGMGVVWAGRDEVLDRDVAVKELIPPSGIAEQHTASLTERSMREARAAARLRSDAAVTVYDVVEQDGRPWIVMALLRPHTLADLLREQGRLPSHQVADIGLRLLDALEAAARVGVLHRDVKPGNVLFDADGRAVLTDFGIASLEGDASITMTGAVLGSPAYVAPERARGHAPTPASDLWSLGVTLYAALEGRPPFERDTALTTLAAVLEGDIPYATHADALQPVLQGLLRRDAQARISAQEARRLLEAVRATTDSEPAAPVVPVAVSTGATAAPEGPKAAPVRWLIPVAALMAALLLLSGVILKSGDGGEDQQGVPAPRAAPQTSQEPQGSPQPASIAPAPTAAASPSRTPSPSRSAANREPAEAPEGFRRYEADGYSVAVPEGWVVDRSNPVRTYFRDPGSRRFLLVEEGGKPKGDPVRDWRRQENGVSRRLAGYERIRIDRADLRNADDAADWEFTWQADGGPLRVLNRAVIADGKAYGLYWSVPEGEWQANRDEFERISRSFRVRA